MAPWKAPAFGEFMQSLTHFLAQERAIAELRQAKILARQAYRTTHEAIERRIPLLSHDIDELRERIWSVQPEFDQLVEIRDQFKDEIRVVGGTPGRRNHYFLSGVSGQPGCHL